MKTRKIGIIGLGHVGAHVAYSLAVQGIADQLVLVDQNTQKAKSECQDLRDSAAYLPHRVTVDVGDFSDLGDCDVLVNSTGKIDILRANHDRLDEMDFTIRAVRSYVDKIRASGFQGVVVNITNPCDIVTRELALGLGLPKGRHRAGHLPAPLRPGPADRHRPQVHHSLYDGGARQRSVCPLVLRQLPGQAPGRLGQNGRAVPL